MIAAVDFETFCADILGEPISPAWVAFFKVVEGLPLSVDEQQLYFAATGRTEYQPRLYTEATGLIGRRGEKTQSSLKFLIYKILTAGWESQLTLSLFARLTRRARLLRVPIICQDMRVNADVKRSAEQLCMDSPVVAQEIADIRATEIEFRNGIALTCFPASKASVRGLTCPAALLDELAWVVIESASDVELLRQVRPSMIQFGNSRRLLKMSTPWMKSGVLYSEYSERAERDDVLVWQASTQAMTPRISLEELEKERERDAVYFSREYEAQFVSDLESFLPQKDIDRAVGDWTELPYEDGVYHIAALDASGLTGGDRFTFGIAGSRGVSVLRGWRREPVPLVLDEIAQLCRDYKIEKVIADQYSFAFVHQLLAERGVELGEQPFSARSKMEIHFALKSALSRGDFLIPRHAEAIKELRALESERRSGGTYRIEAPRGQNDDFATVLALLAWKIAKSQAQPWVEIISVPLGVAPSAGAYTSSDPKLRNDPFNDFGFGGEGSHVASFGRPR